MRRNVAQRWMVRTLASVAVITAAIAVSWAQDAEPKSLELGQVPKPVMSAVLKRFPEAKPQSAVQGVDNNKPFIDVHCLVKGQKIWVTCDPSGAIQAVDREITPKELPGVVTTALNKKYPQATIRMVNEIVEGSAPEYDIALTFQKKAIIAVFAASGEFVEELPDES